MNAWSAWRWLPESKAPLAHGETRPPRKPVWHAALQIIRHPGGPVPRFIWIYAAGMLGFTGLTAVLALYLGQVFGLNEKTIGYVFLYVATLSLVMRSLLLGPIVHRIGEAGAITKSTPPSSAELVIAPASLRHAFAKRCVKISIARGAVDVEPGRFA